MGRLIFLILFFTGTTSLFAQQTDTIASLRINNNFTDFTIDNSGNLYVVINHQQLKKLNRKGDSLAVYNDVKRYGKISSVDATNPFKILVYYQEVSVVVILDRFLSVKQVIDLRKNNIPQAGLVRLSYDNNIWVYDELNSRIKKIDDNGKLLFESADLRNVFDVLPSFDKMFDDSRSLYFYDPGTGWFVFDYYGAFIKKYAFLNWKDVQVLNGEMTGHTDTFYATAKQGDFDFKQIALSPLVSNSRKTMIVNRAIYILYPDKLEIYSAP